MMGIRQGESLMHISHHNKSYIVASLNVLLDIANVQCVHLATIPVHKVTLYNLYG